MIDPSLLTYNIGVTQQQSAPIIEIFEVVKGSAGNMIDNTESQFNLDFLLSHSLMPGVGIEMHEVHTVSCLYSLEALRAEDANGSFELRVLNELDALTPLHKLMLLVFDALDLTHPVSTAGSTTNHNLAKLFRFSSLLSASFPGDGPAADIRCYMPPDKQICRQERGAVQPFKDGEVPSNGEDFKQRQQDEQG
jgi:hypothetical protein